MTLPRRLKTFTTSSVHRRNDNTEGPAIMTFLQNYIANIAHKRSALMNIYEITDLWPRQNSERHWIAGQGAFYGATAACAGFILIGFFMIFSTPIHSMSDELGKDQVMGLVVALFFLFCWISIFWHHHFLKAKLEIIRSAKARLARDADLHDEYLACVERAGAVAVAHSRAAAAAQEARNAVLEGQAMQAQVRAANAQEAAVRKDEASRLSIAERHALAASIRHNTETAELNRRKGLSGAANAGRAAADAAKLAGGRR